MRDHSIPRAPQSKVKPAGNHGMGRLMAHAEEILHGVGYQGGVEKIFGVSGFSYHDVIHA